MWSKELRRTMDYIETRKDLDPAKIAYYGFSWGGALGALLPAMEPRLKTLVLEAGGLYAEHTLPEVDQINFASRIKIPVLMVNGAYDHFFPVETSQKPLFHLFGAAESEKRHVIFESGHVLPIDIVEKEALEWLDRFLGRPAEQARH
jgi:dienelactone hydrolase